MKPTQKILLVEDEFKVSKIYREHLERAGYNVFVAHDGQEGLMMAKNSLPDIILLDIIMPVMDGIEMLKKLKADSGLASIPVVILTNLDTTEGVEAALKAGGTNYLIKSNYSLAQLEVKVREVFKNHKS